MQSREITSPVLTRTRTLQLNFSASYKNFRRHKMRALMGSDRMDVDDPSFPRTRNPAPVREVEEVISFNGKRRFQDRTYFGSRFRNPEVFENLENKRSKTWLKPNYTDNLNQFWRNNNNERYTNRINSEQKQHGNRIEARLGFPPDLRDWLNAGDDGERRTKRKEGNRDLTVSISAGRKGNGNKSYKSRIWRNSRNSNYSNNKTSDLKQRGSFIENNTGSFKDMPTQNRFNFGNSKARAEQLVRHRELDCKNFIDDCSRKVKPNKDSLYGSDKEGDRIRNIVLKMNRSESQNQKDQPQKIQKSNDNNSMDVLSLTSLKTQVVKHSTEELDTTTNEESKKCKALRPIIIDGKDITQSHENGWLFNADAIRISARFFSELGHEVKVFIPKSCVKRYLVKDLEEKNELIFATSPLDSEDANSSFDYENSVLQYAADNDGIIVSNKSFRYLALDNPKWEDIIKTKIMPYKWTPEDEIKVPDYPLGGNSPNREDFLRFPQPPSITNRRLFED